MPALPWTRSATPEPDRTYVVMASRLPLARYRQIPAFLRATVAIRRQLATAEGLIGYALDAKLVRKSFWTLSVWRDEQALASFAHADPHRGRVEQVRPHMLPTTFVTWSTTGAQVPVQWAEARRRVAAAVDG